MFRLSFKLFAIGISVAGLVPCLGFAAPIVQQKLGADGFPVDYKPSDFAIGKEIISKTVPVAGAAVSGSLVTPTAAFAVNTEAVDGLGIMRLGSGGEAPDVWLKSGRAEAENELGRAVAQGVASPALREGWRRLLLTEATPPKAADKGRRPSWLAVRAAALQKLGLFEASWGLWREVPQGALADDTVAAGWVQAKLLAGQAQEGCAVAKSKTVNGGEGGDWAVVMAVCQLVGSGPNPAAASLSLQLVEPVLKAKNPALLRILTAVQDGKPVTTLGGPTTQVDGLGGTVLAAYPALVGPDIMPRMPDVSLRRLAESMALPGELRGRAAVALARQTGLPQDGKTAWMLVSGTAFVGDLPDAVIVARGTGGISSSAVGDYVAAALRLGMVDAAAKAMPLWILPTTASAIENREKLQTQLTLQALQGKIDDALWDSWLLAQPLEVQSGVRQAQRSLLVVEGLGVGVPSRVWQQLRDRAVPVSTLVDPAWQRLLASAVQNEAMPAVLGLISEAWVGQPPAGVVPVVMGASIEALQRVGMTDVARRVAAEAMLGIPSSHLIPLVPEAIVAVSKTLPVVQIGGEAAPVSATVAPEILPPPRVAPIKKPTITVPKVTAPTKPVAPKMGQ